MKPGWQRTEGALLANSSKVTEALSPTDHEKLYPAINHMSEIGKKSSSYKPLRWDYSAHQYLAPICVKIPESEPAKPIESLRE